jgi:Gamma-glutamyl cyclotransferase, AIG2-like
VRRRRNGQADDALTGPVRFFFYGTLLDPLIRASVLGPAPLAVRPAVLPHWRRWRRRNEPFPVLWRAARSTVQGIVVEGLGQGAVLRLFRYEGAFYRLARVRPVLEGGGPLDAFAFVPVAGEPPGRCGWDLETWRKRHRRRALRALTPAAGVWLRGASGAPPRRLSSSRPSSPRGR